MGTYFPNDIVVECLLLDAYKHEKDNFHHNNNFSFFIVWLLYKSTSDNSYEIYASGLGTIITIIAFGITLYQLGIVKEQNKKIQIETTKAAKNASEKIRTVLTVAEISETINYLQLIQQNLMVNKIEIALYQMKEINKFLLELLKDDTYKDILRSNFKSRMNSYSADISTLQSCITGQQVITNLDLIIMNVYQLEENIILVRNHLKQQAYE